MVNDPAQRQHFAAANRALIREQFSWRAVAQRYEGIFQQAERDTRRSEPPARRRVGTGK
jgi:glycosyltransferase involved in cell wall biosynthesis